jgi:hypothetical protein
MSILVVFAVMTAACCVGVGAIMEDSAMETPLREQFQPLQTILPHTYLLLPGMTGLAAFAVMTAEFCAGV